MDNTTPIYTLISCVLFLKKVDLERTDLPCGAQVSDLTVLASRSVSMSFYNFKVLISRFSVENASNEFS